MDIVATTNDQLWSTDSINVILDLFKISLIVIGLLMNCFVLFILFRGKIHFSDICTITIFANTLADLFVTLTFIFSDMLLPIYSKEVIPFVCKFRRYVLHVSQTGEILLLSALALFHNDKLHTCTFGQAPCGVFIFPALIWFFALSCNVWSVVLYECKYTTYIVQNCSMGLLSCSDSNCFSFISAISHLNTDAAFVPMALLIETIVTIGVPLLIAICLLIHAQRNAPIVTYRLKLAWILFTINGLLVMPNVLTQLIFEVFQQDPKSVSLIEIVFSTTSQCLHLVHQAVKPLFYIILQTEIRKVVGRFKIGRLFGIKTNQSEVMIRLSPIVQNLKNKKFENDTDSPTSSFMNSLTRKDSVYEDASLLIQPPTENVTRNSTVLQISVSST